jgi:hypothetical protein
LLRLNLPATSVRDLIVKDADLALGTHGRGFYILDDIEPLREMDDRLLLSDAHLFRPERALRVHWNGNTDTPLPPDEPMADNPPDGIPIDYYLRSAAPGGLVLEVIDDAGKVVRRFSSDDPRPEPRDEGNVPRYWIRPAAVPSREAGFHRLVWDLHGEAPEALETSFPIAAIVRNTPREPRGPWALPGRYTVRLSAGSRRQEQPLEIAMDPRVKTPLTALRAQHDLSLRLADALGRDTRAALEVRRARGSAGNLSEEVRTKLAALEGTGARRHTRGGAEIRSLTSMNAELMELFGHVEEVDAAPTAALVQAAESALRETETLLSAWDRLRPQALRRER